MGRNFKINNCFVFVLLVIVLQSVQWFRSSEAYSSAECAGLFNNQIPVSEYDQFGSVDSAYRYITNRTFNGREFYRPEPFSKPTMQEIVSKIYVSDYCNENVLRLISFFQEFVPSFDITKANVLYLYPRKIGNFVVPVYSDSSGWGFHVILEYEGKIYDLDMYRSLQTGPVRGREVTYEDFQRVYYTTGVREYFGKNFPGNIRGLLNRWDHFVPGFAPPVWLKEIPAADYLRDYMRKEYDYRDDSHRYVRGNYLWYLRESDTEYPPQSIQQYLKRAREH